MLIVCLLSLEQTVVSSVKYYEVKEFLSERAYSTLNAADKSAAVLAGIMGCILVGAACKEAYTELSRKLSRNKDLANSIQQAEAVYNQYQQRINDAIEQIKTVYGVVSFVKCEKTMSELYKSHIGVNGMYDEVCAARTNFSNCYYSEKRSKQVQDTYDKLTDLQKKVTVLKDIYRFCYIITVHDRSDLINAINRHYIQFSDYPLVHCMQELRVQLHYLSEKGGGSFEQILKSMIPKIAHSVEYKKELEAYNTSKC